MSELAASAEQIVTGTVAQLFGGIALAPATEQPVRAIVARCAHEQMQLDSRAVEHWERMGALADARDRALKSLVTNKRDRTKFNANVKAARATLDSGRRQADAARAAHPVPLLCESCGQREPMSECIGIGGRSGYFCRLCAIDHVADAVATRPEFVRAFERECGRDWSGVEIHAVAAEILDEMHSMSVRPHAELLAELEKIANSTPGP